MQGVEKGVLFRGVEKAAIKLSMKEIGDAKMRKFRADIDEGRLW